MFCSGETKWRNVMFSEKEFVSLEVKTKYAVENNYTLQKLMENLPADEMIEYLKDNEINICSRK
jgi:hypothetical protein